MAPAGCISSPPVQASQKKVFPVEGKEFSMRKGHLFIAGAGALLLAACSGDKKSAINDDLKKDLEMASSSDGITLANASNSGTQVVSAIEQTTPPARHQAASAPVRRHHAAPKSPPRVVQTKAPASVTETEPQEVASAPSNDATPVSPRPRPASVSYPSGPSSGGDDGRVSTGSSAGAVIGTILGAVIRGGVVGDGDSCDPRTDGRNRGGISINRGIPFPIPGGGRVLGSGRPRIGGSMPLPPSRFPTPRG
jgi:hypothetical protein